MRFFRWIGLRFSRARRQWSAQSRQAARQVCGHEPARSGIAGKLFLSALAVAFLATPVFAQHVRYAVGRGHVHKRVAHQTPRYGYIYNRQHGYTYVPPPPSLLNAPQRGNSYTPVYVPGFGNIGSNRGVAYGRW